MAYVKYSDFVEHMELKNAVPEVDYTDLKIEKPEVNRCSPQLAGFYQFFDHTRVQVVGNVEYAYAKELTPEERSARFRALLEKNIPCLVFTNGMEPFEELKPIAIEFNTPVFVSDKRTVAVTGEMVRWLNEEMAPVISVHGVLMDVYGEGVLITGESGIGKSETALELLKRGHRLVSDDVVEIKKINDEVLFGAAPELTRHFVELRGIGVIDVKTLFGIECVEDYHRISLVINLVDYNNHKDMKFDRLGIDPQYVEYHGVQVASHTIPVRPGRNLSIIIETAAVNHRQKKMGYNAAEELTRRVQQSIHKFSKK